MGEQEPLHTYLYSFGTEDTPNLFSFLWSGFICLDLGDWTGWSRDQKRKEDRQGWRQEAMDRGSIRRICPP